MKKKLIGICCSILIIVGILAVWKGLSEKCGGAESSSPYEKSSSVLVNHVPQADITDLIPDEYYKWKAINDDVYAWIDIEDTNVHYPILQNAGDDSYYLDHTIYREKTLPGSIYTEKINSKDFSDFNTLIYGHDMRDGSMFKHLHKFSDPEFFETHDTIMIYTEESVNEYRVYAAVAYDNRHIMYSFDQSKISERRAFIESLSEMQSTRNQYRKDMTIDTDSKLITLSTCITGQPDKRFIVVAELVEN